MENSQIKILILTFHSAFNYGAMLQCYALYTYLKKQFSNIEVIDFRPEEFSVKFNILRPTTWIKKYISNTFLSKIQFTKRYDAKQIRENPPIADVYIIGSDQVWNPEITKNNQDIYFGDFIEIGRKKIAYAASFGQTRFSTKEIYDMKNLIHDYSAISVREESGVELCKEIGYHAQCVLDPVFLLNATDYINKKLKIKNDLGLFMLNNNTDDCFIFAKKVADDLGLKPKIINKGRVVRGFKIIPFPTVNRFLTEMASSKFIVTNSFHGLAFSIIFRKSFIFISTDHKKNTRAISLLNKLGLEHRMYNDYLQAQKDKIWKNPIDYSSIDNKITQLKQESAAFLNTNIC